MGHYLVYNVVGGVGNGVYNNKGSCSIACCKDVVRNYCALVQPEIASIQSRCNYHRHIPIKTDVNIPKKGGMKYTSVHIASF